MFVSDSTRTSPRRSDLNGSSPHFEGTSPQRLTSSRSDYATGVSSAHHNRPTGISASPSLHTVDNDYSLSASAATGIPDLPVTSNSLPSPDSIHAVSSYGREGSGELPHDRQRERSHRGQQGERLNERSLDSSAAEAAHSQNFQTDLLRSLIRESQEEMRDHVHTQIRNLHVDMIRQFQIQLVSRCFTLQTHCAYTGTQSSCRYNQKVSNPTSKLVYQFLIDRKSFSNYILLLSLPNSHCHITCLNE